MTLSNIPIVCGTVTLVAGILEMIFILMLCDKCFKFQMFLARTFIIGSFITILSLLLWLI